MKDTDDNFSLLNPLSDNIVSAYSAPLDEAMKEIYTNVISKNGDYDPALLDIYCLKLSNILYFMQTNLESVGLKDDISRSLA